MSKTYFISDYHIGHTNVMRFDERPFKDLKDMEQKLIEKWNNKVQNDDTVYFLGDMFWCDDIKARAILKTLKGNKILIPGNHMKGVKNQENRKLFQGIYDYKELNIDDKFVIISHYPIFSWKNMRYNSIHLYGHLHNTKEQKLFEQNIKMMRGYDLPYRAYNVGCMMPYMNYEPQDLDTITKEGEKYYKQLFAAESLQKCFPQSLNKPFNFDGQSSFKYEK